MTRQRIRPSLRPAASTRTAPLQRHGRGEDGREHGDRGRAQADDVRPDRTRWPRITVTVEEEVANYLNNKKRRDLVAAWRQENNVEVQVVSGEGLSPEFLKIDCVDANGREVRFPGE